MSNYLSLARRPALFVAVWVILSGAILSGARAATARQDEVDNIVAGANNTQPPADAGNQLAGNPVVNPAAPAGGEQKKSQASTNMLVWLFQALGALYTVAFLALSIALVTLIVMNIIASRRDNVCPPDLIEGVEQNFAEGNRQAAAELIRTDDSFLGQVVSAGLSRLDRGHTSAIEAMQEVGEEELMKMEHSLGYMALIGNISPMVGLLGTVDGMVQAFRQIATSGSTPNPADLAMNISTALVTTLAGLIIAIPAIAICNILKNRVQRLTLQVGVVSEEIIEKFIKK
jgi:biopolymer transport protein ExbB